MLLGIANVDEMSLYHDGPIATPGSYAMLLAAVFEYVAATYGPAMIPVLLARLPQHDSAKTLIPATFGVPRAKFEQGWRAFLIERYDVELTQR